MKKTKPDPHELTIDELRRGMVMTGSSFRPKGYTGPDLWDPLNELSRKVSAARGDRRVSVVRQRFPEYAATIDVAMLLYVNRHQL